MFAVIITSYKILATKQEKGTFILLVLGILWNNTKIGSSIFETSLLAICYYIFKIISKRNYYF
jgi:hypothetical protein